MFVIGKLVNGDDVTLVIKELVENSEKVVTEYPKLEANGKVIEGIIFDLQNAEIPKTQDNSFKFFGFVYVPGLKKFVKIGSFIPAGVAAGLIAAKINGAKYAIVAKQLHRQRQQHKTIDKAEVFEIADSNAVATLDKIERVENGGNVEKLEKVSLKL